MSIAQCEVEAPPIRLGFRRSVEKELRDRDMDKEADRWVGCHKNGVVVACRWCGEEFILPYRCELRICGKCAESHRRRLWFKYQKIRDLHLGGGYTWKFLTLTLKYQPGDPIKGRIDRILSGSRQLIKKTWRREKWFGLLGVMEITSTGYVHFHALVYGSWQDQKLLSQRWEEITGDSKVVDIRRVRGFKKALGDVLKYVSKMPEYADPGFAVDVLEAVKGKRRVFSLGKFYAVREDSARHKFVCPKCGGDTYFVRTQDLAWWNWGQFLADLWREPG